MTSHLKKLFDNNINIINYSLLSIISIFLFFLPLAFCILEVPFLVVVSSVFSLGGLLGIGRIIYFEALHCAQSKQSGTTSDPVINVLVLLKT